MSKSFITAMMLVLLGWGLLLLIFVGIGLFIRRVYGLKMQGTESLFSSFWVGWAAAIFFLQLWHFYFHVNQYSFALIALGGMIGLFWNFEDLWNFIRGKFSKNLFFCSIQVITVVWLAGHAIVSPLNYDSGLYHLTSIRWTISFPIVPGLGNLHSRLAFNSAHFLYCAMLEIGPWIHRSHHLANGLLLVTLFAQIFFSGSKLLEGKWQLHHGFTLLLLVPLLNQVPGTNISGTSPDFAIFILCIVLSSQLLAFLGNRQYTLEEIGYDIFFMAVIAMVGIIIKVSFLAFGGITMLLALILWSVRIGKHDRAFNRKVLAWIIICIAIALIPWVIRSIILSGYIAYPIPYGSIPVEWRIPHADVINMANTIRGWALTPHVHWKEVLGNWNWFRPWAIRTFKNSDVIRPLLLIALSCLLMLFFTFSKKYSLDHQGKVWLFLLPPIGSLVFWFCTAPDVRFAGSCFWILGAGTIALVIGDMSKLKDTLKVYIILIFCIFMGLNTFITGENNFVKTVIRDKNILKAFQQVGIAEDLMYKLDGNDGFYKIPQAELNTFKTNSGLVVYVPQKGDQCWDAPLPCTPYPNPYLRLRKKGVMRNGFVLDKKSSIVFP